MAELVPRRESGELVSLRDAVDRLFRESFVRPWGEFLPSVFGGGGMAVDVYEEDDHIKVEATMPGVKAEDIDIRVQDDVLTIKAESRREKDISEERYTYRERAYGMMQRQVSLPSAVDVERAEAKLENGVLTLSLPKAEREKARQIKIKTK